MQEFDKHDLDTTVQFEVYEVEWQRQTPGLGAQETTTISWPSTEPAQQMEESDDDDDEQEPSLFDILDDDAEEDPEDDVPEDQHA